MPPGQCKWNSSEDDESVFQIAKHGKQQNEYQQQGHGHDDLQPLCGGLQVFELPTPGGPVTRRDLHLRFQRSAGFRDERTEVAIPHVGADHDAPLAILAADLVRAGGQFQGCQFRQRDKADTVAAC